MERTLGGLVAIMFITILVMGVVSLIGALASIVTEKKFRTLDPKMSSWIVLLLLVHLNVFWETPTILEQDDWAFAAFVFVIAGPMLLFFASQTLLTNQNSEIETFTEDHYQAVAQQFFLTLCILMIWAIAIEFILGDGAIVNGLADLSVLIVFAALAVARSKRIHTLLAIVSWVLILGLFVLAGLQVID